jgi:predicted nucleic acid-binding protein
VLRRYVHLGGVLRGGGRALGSFLRLPISAVHGPEVYLRALDLARRLGHAKAYDVQYLAVAQIQDCAVVTVDRGLHESARTLGIASRLIA